MSNLKLREFVTDSSEQYVHVAAALAGDLSRLVGLRGSLRQRMEQSPLMDAPGFASDVEIAFGQMWKTWCAVPVG